VHTDSIWLTARTWCRILVEVSCARNKFTYLGRSKFRKPYIVVLVDDQLGGTRARSRYLPTHGLILPPVKSTDHVLIHGREPNETVLVICYAVWRVWDRVHRELALPRIESSNMTGQGSEPDYPVRVNCDVVGLKVAWDWVPSHSPIIPWFILQLSYTPAFKLRVPNG
jgi:hypothetical protein